MSIVAGADFGTLNTRIILEGMQEKGVPVNRVINGGGIPQKNEVLNRIYANALNKPVLVPTGDVTSLGSAIVAFVACGAYASVDKAQDALCPTHRVQMPDEHEAAVYDRLYLRFRDVYFALGLPNAQAAQLGHILPTLRRIASVTQTREGK